MSVSIAFLDRDGTIIRDHGYVSEPSQVELLPRAAAAIARLNARSIPTVVVTNQSGIGRGYYNETDFRAVQAEVERQLALHGCALDAVYYCPHDPERGTCPCRKPGLELYRRAARRFGVPLEGAVFVGDKPHDVAPAGRTGGRGFLVRTGQRVERPPPPGTEVVADLWEAVERMLDDRGDTGAGPSGERR